MINEMVKRVAKAIYTLRHSTHEGQARAAIEAMRELPEEPGPKYTAGEYSRHTQSAMVDDALEDVK